MRLCQSSTSLSGEKAQLSAVGVVVVFIVICHPCDLLTLCRRDFHSFPLSQNKSEIKPCSTAA